MGIPVPLNDSSTYSRLTPDYTRNEYILRLIACSIVLALHLAVLDFSGPWFVWVLLIFHCLIYPHLTYFIARRFKPGANFVLIDFFWYGFMVAVWGFNPFLTTAFISGIVMTGLAAGGFSLIWKGLGCLLSGMGVAILLNGAYFRENIELMAAIIAGAGLLAYSTALGFTVYMVSASLASAKSRMGWQKDRMRDIAEVSKAVNSHLDLDEVMGYVIESLNRMYPLEQIFLSLLSPDESRVVIIRTYGDYLTADQKRAVEGYMIERRENPASIFVKACDRLSPIYLPKVDRPTQPEAAVDQLLYDVKAPRSMALFPLVVEGRAIGSLGFLNYQETLQLQSADMDNIAEFLLHVATAIRNSELFVELEQARNEAEEARAEAEASEEAKSQFLANMSHEIRTPMTAILGYAEALTDPALDEVEKQRFARTIVRSGHHLLNIINDILDLSKIQSGKLTAERVDVDLAALLEELNSNLGGLAQEKGVDFRLACEYPLPAQVFSDPTRLRQILLNLGVNAIKFTGEGQVSLRVRYLSSPTSTLVFDMRDTGIGIEEEALQKIFSAFQQADASTTRKYGGTGLGLHISRKLARLLGGDIDVQSQPGKGSTFTLRVGAEPVDERWLESERDRMLVSEEGLNRATQWPDLSGAVLVAEDNPDNQVLIAYLLRRCGVRYQMVANGVEAIRQLELRSYDLVLLDIQMPECGGEAVVQWMRSHDRRTPAVAITANMMSHQVESYLKQGFQHCLSKPVNRDQFCDTLSRFLPARIVCTEPEILLVEDNPVNAMLLKKQVAAQRPEIVVRLATSGEEALAQLAQSPMPLVLMDIEMPGMDGLTALASLRESGYRLPICMLSGHASTEDRQRSLAAGADQHLTKPLSKEGLAEVLQRYLPPLENPESRQV